MPSSGLLAVERRLQSLDQIICRNAKGMSAQLLTQRVFKILRLPPEIALPGHNPYQEAKH
jgi:hypothetical protein